MANRAFTGGSPYTVPDSITVQSNRTGYDVVASRLSKQRREKAAKHTNASLHDGTHFVKFFCIQNELGLGLSGSTGQSRYVRDFYPHNIVIPTLKVYGQCIDQQEYARTIEFIRQAQREGVAKGQLTQIHIGRGGSNLPRPIIRGAHKPILAQGYVKTVERKHERFVYAPFFSFEFVIAEMLAGVYEEVRAENPEEKTWAEIVNNLRENKPAAPKKESNIPFVVEDTASLAEELAKKVNEGLKGF